MVEFLHQIIAWANANDGLLQALALIGAAGGLILSVARATRLRVKHGGSAVTANPDAESAQEQVATIAVMPFSVQATEPEQEYLAEGLAEDLITLLARIPGFWVIARQSTMVYQDAPVDIRQIGKDLGVRYVIEGQVRKAGDQVRVNARLCETSRGTHLWTGKFDRATTQLATLHDELAGAVAAQLEPELVRAEADLAHRQPLADWDAWTYYKRAHARLLLGGWHEETFTEATDLLRKAITLDPDFALAHAYLALLLALGWRIGLDIDRPSVRKEAGAEAERAMAIEASQSEIQGYAGCALADIDETNRGISILEQAVITNPSNAQAWVALGAARLVADQVEQGVADLQHGIEISPRDPRLAFWNALLARGLAGLGRVDEALELTRIACRQDPRSHVPRVVRAFLLAMTQREAEARAALEEARKIRPNLSFRELEIFLSPFGDAIRPLWESLDTSASSQAH